MFVRARLIALAAVLAAVPAVALGARPAGRADFTLGALPTTLRLPAGEFAFRLTHRFARPIAAGSAGDFFADFFGFDSSAQIGFEVRYGVLTGTQAAIDRTNNRAIQFLGQHQMLRQDDRRPLSADVVVAIEGANNFSEDFAPTIGGVVSHRLADRAVVYAQPLFVFHAEPDDPELTDRRHAFVLGLGARLRLGASRTYVVVEAAPRLAGYDAGVDHVSVGIERRAGGHVFQFNISNALGTTFRQIARAARPRATGTSAST